MSFLKSFNFDYFINQLSINNLFTVISIRYMKPKKANKSKTKVSLQKTSSTIINNHTHRNSIISETLPLYYNDSMLSIRTSSIRPNM